ncbi:MAG: hypothetical protein FJW38_17625 [Acidobacteria bacterium]|nr:hypothetical protein [Acidobacteriota bacterium]
MAAPRSMLVDFRDPRNYPEIAWLAENYERIRIFRDWAFGGKNPVREPQKADERSDRLSEDFSNLGTFLSRLRTQFPAAKRDILNKLKDLYDGVSDWDLSIVGGTVQIVVTEGLFNIPASRLSDGTLRYLCLLAILCDPEPPPLICIEEPELGLHPDMIPKVADLLRDAATRTQLIVTTHSDILVDEFTDMPEAIIVCSKEEGQAKMERLDPKEMAVWLEKYRLGDLWTSGHIGGNRW